MFAPNTRILIVDDSTSLRAMTKTYLKALKFRDLYESVNGGDAYRAILEAKRAGDEFGLILCDWKMPELDGIGLLSRLRLLPQFENLPFIMMTTESEKARVIEALHAKTSGYLIKPFDEEALKQKLSLVWASLQKKTATA